VAAARDRLALIDADVNVKGRKASSMCPRPRHGRGHENKTCWGRVSRRRSRQIVATKKSGAFGNAEGWTAATNRTAASHPHARDCRARARRPT